MCIALEPGFNWWVFCVLKKEDTKISLVKQHNFQYLKKTHKYSLPLPKSVEDALAIDRHSDSTVWKDAIAKEMKNVRFAFDALEDGRNVPHGFHFVKYHMIFNIKMEDFCQKACLVASRHMTNVPATFMYASIVTCKTVCIALMLAALNLLEVMHSNEKRSVYNFIQLFFVHIPLIYQISMYTSLYTKIFKFSHSRDFHIPFLYQNFHIPTTYQNLLHIPAEYQSVKIPFLVFAVVRHYFLGDITNY